MTMPGRPAAPTPPADAGSSPTLSRAWVPGPFVLGPFVLALTLAGAVPGGARAVQAAESGAPVIEIPTEAVVLDEATLVRERADNAVIDRMRRYLADPDLGFDATTPLPAPLPLSEEDGAGAGGRAGRSGGGAVREVPLRIAALRALENSLAIRRGEVARALADQALAEAEAVFDPVLGLTFDASHSSTRERKVWDERYKQGTVNIGGEDRLYYTTGYIEYLAFNAPRPAGYYLSEVEASKKSLWDTSAFILTGSLLQRLPWGQELSLQLQTTYQERFYVVKQGSGDLQASYPYSRPWVAQTGASTTVPLPFTRQWGQGYPAMLNRALKGLAADHAAWATRAVVNDTLLEVNEAYWTLVRAVMRMNAAAATLAKGEALRERTVRQHELYLTTDGGLSQVTARTLRLEGDLVAAHAEYVRASETLRNRIGLKDPVLLAPIGYRTLLDRQPLAMDDPALVLDNPQVRAAALRLRIATTTRDARDRQRNPDIRISGSVTSKESNALFGYETFHDAMKHLPTDPDQVTTTAGIAWSEPIGNQAAEASFRRAEAQVAMGEIDHRRVARSLRTTFDNARLGVDSARTRITITRRGIQAAEEAYERAERRHATGLVPDFELTELLTAVQSAHFAEAEALAEARKAEGRLLASVGALAGRYPSETAQTETDRRRLESLSRQGILDYFGPPAAETDAGRDGAPPAGRDGGTP